MTGVLLFAGGVLLGLLPYLYAKAEQRAYRGRHVAEVTVDDVGLEIFRGPFEPFIHTEEEAQLAARTPADDAGEAARPWFVEIESCRINGEDDVMSPEPAEIVWANTADDAHDLVVRHRDYDTNLLTARPATEAEARAGADRLRAEVERFVVSLETADADCGSCSQRLSHAARLRKILSGTDTRTCGCRGIANQVCDICQGVAAADPVSLADVRACGTPGCDGDARYAAPGRGHHEKCTWPRNSEAVTDHG